MYQSAVFALDVVMCYTDSRVPEPKVPVIKARSIDSTKDFMTDEKLADGSRIFKWALRSLSNCV